MWSILIKVILMSTLNIHFIINKKTNLKYPKIYAFLGYQENFLWVQKRVRIGHGKRDIEVRVIEVLLLDVHSSRRQSHNGLYTNVHIPLHWHCSSCKRQCSVLNIIIILINLLYIYHFTFLALVKSVKASEKGQKCPFVRQYTFP